MEKEKKYARTTPAQLRFYITFIRSHPELLQGKNCPTSPNCIKLLWQEIATNLNAMLGPTRTTDSWKEALRNWRKQLQARACKIIIERNRTGGGQNLLLELSEFEQQTLEAFGLAAVEGHSGVTLGFTVLTNADNGQQQSAEISLDSTTICSTPLSIPPNPYEIPDANVPSISSSNNEGFEPPPTRRNIKTFCETILETVQQDMKERREEQVRLAESLQSMANGITTQAEVIKGAALAPFF